MLLLFSLRVYPRDRFWVPFFLTFFLTICSIFINRANLSNYADDNQIYFCDRDPEVVKSVINGDLAVASRWFDDNKLVLNIIPRNVKMHYSSKKLSQWFFL